MSHELKPCPFCGEDVVLAEKGLSKKIVCRCTRHPGWWFETRKRWNTRPIEDALRAENEKLREEIEHLQLQIELLQTNRRLLNRDLAKAHEHIAELEQERDATASDLLWTSRGYDKPPQPPKEGE